MPIYYFGYGSNMSAKMMQAWCSDYTLIGTAQLPDWKLAFTRLSKRWGAGVADIIEQAGETVWGGLYEISETDLTALDRKESNGVYYQRIHCSPVIGDTVYKAFTYIVIDKASQPIATSVAYRDTMLTGAKELQLPNYYIQHIASLPIANQS